MAFSTINKGSSFMNTVLYTGTGSSQSLTGVGFQPDLVWIKDRDATRDHNLFDAVRGVQKRLESNGGIQEATRTDALSAFDSNGFSFNGGNVAVNTTSDYVSWNWKANGTGSLNTDGSSNSTVSANTTSGFSIVRYTGTGTNANFGHGLGVAPEFIIVKRLDADSDWATYHMAQNSAVTPANYRTKLNESQRNYVTDYWLDNKPTASIFYVHSEADVNTTGGEYVAYCFASVTGFCKINRYIGNNSSDGAFIYLGFKPSVVIAKRFDDNDGYSWYMMTAKASDSGGGNPLDRPLFCNTDGAENNGDNNIDFLSNGFKIRGTGAAQNGNTVNYGYIAWGQPIISNGGVCATAR